MDTRFWGPSGWKLMHLSAAVYQPDKRIQMNRWLSTLPYILPCKFCRASLISYYEELPPDYTDARSLSRWLWQVHGKVNDKLRSQGQSIPKDPPFAAVYNKYKGLAKNVFAGCRRECTELEKDIQGRDGVCMTVEKYCSQQIWDFLFSVAFQHPRATKSAPMPDTPQHLPCNLSQPDKCRWNLLEPAEKMPYFRRFWASLAEIFPERFSQLWKEGLLKNPMNVESKQAALKWLYKQYKFIYTHADPKAPLSIRSYPAIISELEMHSSDCNKSKRARTCRRVVKSSKAKTRRRVNL